MTPSMHRKTAFLIALATVSAAGVGFLAAGTAFGAEWTEYDGRVSAGQAYLVAVPEDAETLQIEFLPGLLSSGSARATLFDPGDDRVGHYVLDAEESKVTIDEPEEGGYVLYVFDVSGGVLTAAVKADAAEDLELVALETETESLELAEQDSMGAFRAITTVDLDREPVFESLLYRGSVDNLTGTVRTLDGETVRVSAESGTAHGPGLFTEQSGERKTFPENFGAGLHTIEAIADQFEGTLYLTVVNYVRPNLDADVPEVPDEIVVPANALVLDEEWMATAVEVPAGETLTLGLIPQIDEDEEGDEEDYSRYHHRDHALLAVFDPEDQLLAFVELDGEEEAARTVDLNGPGEYVFFLYWASGEGVFAVLDDGAAAFGAERHLKTEVVETTLAEPSNEVGWDETFEIEMARAPLAAGIGIEGDTSFAIDMRSTIHTDEGEVDSYSWEFFPGAAPYSRMGHYHCYVGEELVAGTWSIDVEAALVNGEVTLYTLEYLRDIPAEDDEEEDEETEEEDVLGLPL